MASCDSLGWSFIEEAVIRDRGYDEEAVLTSILQSHFIRRGFVDSLAALNEELRELGSIENNFDAGCYSDPVDAKGNGANKRDASLPNGNGKCNGKSAAPAEESGDPFAAVLDAMAKRKRAQTLCLREAYEDAAALLPERSVCRVKLLAMEALKRARADQPAALLFLCERVGPLVAASSDAVAAHHTYMDSLAAIAGVGPVGWSPPPPCVMAHEVNESLLDDQGPSALDLLVLWSDWQSSIRSKEHKGKFPFLTQDGLRKA